MLEDKELYRLLGSLEEASRTTAQRIESLDRQHLAGIIELKSLLQIATVARETNNSDIEKRLSRLEVAVGKFTVKMAIGGILVIAIFEKGLSLVLQRFFDAS